MEKFEYDIRLPLEEAKSFKERFFGLMFKRSSERSLLFRDCSAIHTFFMRFDIDAAFFDKNKKLIKEVKKLKPWRVAFLPRSLLCHRNSGFIRGRRQKTALINIIMRKKA